ncbi:transcriptional repressor LexA [Nodosilinea sp. PGN35]|uniref:transcriptional repressor LexA n=1 Tax=Nodosilinea sp. PGN35 TaxID=3020489 RepID=UPI0023B2C63B|nr:transcriptional repressor LexA [Nodosilinea sp. TSF1-S3]MDF0369448.1 transcriptional repressor LexA [Nodosilinea sp. TSF1-S3]
MLLLPSERRLHDCLRQWVAIHGYAPTIREMKTALKASSTSSVQDLLERLQRKGLIDRQRGRSRAIRLRFSELPLQGRIQAGYLTEQPNCWEWIRLDGNCYEKGDYALKVCGDSMVMAQIFDGDVVVIRPTQDIWAIRPGQIAVVLIEGEGTTLKHVYCREGDRHVILKPANPALPSRTLEWSQVGVQGVMVGLHRLSDELWIAI